jgi:hypothetical protein
MARTFLHPVSRELALGARNRIAAAAARPAETAFHALAWLALAAAAVFVWSRLDGDRLGIWIASWVNTPWVSAPALGVVALWTVRKLVQATAAALHEGWWAAAPVPRAAERLWLAIVAIAAALAWVLLAAALLHAIAAVAVRPTPWLAPALTLILPALAAGSLAGALLAAVGGGDDARVGYASHGLPLYRLPLPRALPELAQWQRIEALRSFRAGGRIWPFLLLGLAVPAGITLPSLTGLLVLGVVLIWYGGVLKAAHDVIHAGHALLAAQPLRTPAYARATVHYPALAAVATMLLGVVALALQEAPPAFLVGFAVLVPAWTALDLAIVLHHRAAPRRAAIALSVAVVALVACAQVFPPLVLPAWAALLIHHVLKLRSIA